MLYGVIKKFIMLLQSTNCHSNGTFLQKLLFLCSARKVYVCTMNYRMHKELRRIYLAFHSARRMICDWVLILIRSKIQETSIRVG